MDDLDDTVIVPPRPLAPPADSAIEDTVINPVSDRARPGPRELKIGMHSAAVPVTPPYRFRLGDSAEPIALDVPAYIGRRPSSPRIISGVVPRLVVVPSPQHEVSSTHLELLQLGNTVVATDMKSTNGSLVLVPGSDPRKLRQGESVVVSPGTIVDIGDGNIIEILPMQRMTNNPVVQRPEGQQ